MYIRMMTAAALAVAVAFAKSGPAYVQFSPPATKGALYKPDSGSAPHIAGVLTHRAANFLSPIATRERSKRGFLVLAMNPRFENNESAVNWDRLLEETQSESRGIRNQNQPEAHTYSMARSAAIVSMPAHRFASSRFSLCVC